MNQSTTQAMDPEALRGLPREKPGLDREHLLNTIQMAQFVRDGFIRFDEVVPRAWCEDLMAELEAGLYGPYETEGVPFSDVWPEPLAAGRIFRLPAVRGLIESLVGPNPRYDHHCPHLRVGPDNGHQALHQDAATDPRREAFDIQLSLFPHDIPPEMGGTLFVPGSHMRHVDNQSISRYQNIVGQVQTVCQAGTLVAWHADLWHAGRANRTDRKRYMFKLRLNPMVRQYHLWNTDDLHDPEVDKQVRKTIGQAQPWHGNDDRIEMMNRVRLWRTLTGDQTFDLNMYWTRTGNVPQGHYNPSRSGGG